MTPEWVFIMQMLVFYAGALALGGFVYWLAKRDSRKFDEQVEANSKQRR